MVVLVSGGPWPAYQLPYPLLPSQLAHVGLHFCNLLAR